MINLLTIPLKTVVFNAKLELLIGAYSSSYSFIINEDDDRPRNWPMFRPRGRSSNVISARDKQIP